MNSEILFGFGLLQTSVLIVLMFRGRHIISGRIMLCWMFANWLNILLSYLCFSHNNSLINSIGSSIVLFTYGPFLYLYTKYLTQAQLRFKPLHLLHFLPFLLVLGIQFYDPQNAIFNAPRFIQNFNLNSQFTFMYFLIVGSAYSAAAIIKIHQAVHKLDNLYSNKSHHRLLRSMGVLIVFLWLIVVGIYSYLAWGSVSVQQPLDAPLLSAGVSICVIMLVGFFGMAIPDIFFLTPSRNSFENDMQQYHQMQQNLSTEMQVKQMSALINQVSQQIRQQKLYLKPDLSLNDLARYTGQSQMEILQAINKIKRKSFYHYINSFRLTEFMRNHPNTPCIKTIWKKAQAYGFDNRIEFAKFYRAKTGFRAHHHIVDTLQAQQ